MTENSPQDQPSVPLSLIEELEEQEKKSLKDNPHEDESLPEEEEDEEEGGKDKGGSKGQKGIKTKPDLEQLFDTEDDQDEDWKAKVKLLMMAPFSTLVPGASALDSESDLKKRLLLAEIGLRTHQIEPQDIADPNLIQKLEERLLQRQVQFSQQNLQNLQNPSGSLSQLSFPTKILGAVISAASVMAIPLKTEMERLRGSENSKGIAPDLKKETAQKNERVNENEAEERKLKDRDFLQFSDQVYDDNKDLKALIDLVEDVTQQKSFADEMDSVDSYQGGIAKGATGPITLTETFSQSAALQGGVQAISLNQSLNLNDMPNMVDVMKIG
jgi:hypothetical protein